jgi:hypothetical protein
MTVKDKLDEFIQASRDNSAHDIGRQISEQNQEHITFKFRDDAIALPTAISSPFGYIPAQSIPIPKEITDYIES